MAQEVEDKGAFDDILGFNEDEQGTGEDQSSGKKPEKSLEERFASLEETTNNQAEIIRQLEEENKSLKGNSDTISKLRDVFVPDEGATAEAQRDQLLRDFDKDPLSVIDSLVAKRLEPLQQNFSSSQLNYNSQRVMDEIDRDYVVDWNKDAAKITKHLDTMTQDYKQSNPKEAVLSAMRLAKVGKKRKSSVPFYESGDLASQMEKKKQESEAAAYKKRILNVKKSNDPLGGFFNAVKNIGQK